MKHSVYTGLDNIDSLGLNKGLRIGLVTNLSACDRLGKSSIEVIAEKYTLCALFAPEHGLKAQLDAGKSFKDTDYASTAVYSLYGDKCSPDTEVLKQLDALIYDIQDVGARHYTYLTTLAYCMKACAENKTPFIVFDRPNPLGGKVNGEMLEEQYTSFVGKYPVPTRYGLTVGEYASYINNVYAFNCPLTVCKMKGWNSSLLWSDTDLKWRAPSPNIPSFETCFYYLSTCFFEATNLSEGRGTPYPFRVFAAPDLDAEIIAYDLNSRILPGVSFSNIKLTPTSSKWQNTECNAVLLTIDDYKSFNALKVKLNIFDSVRKYCPALEINRDFFCKLTGSALQLDNKLSLNELTDKFNLEASDFAKTSSFCRIYN